MALLNLTGQHFGKLTARRLQARVRGRRPQWLCDCACGGKAVVATLSLRSGDTKSCGCLKKAGRAAYKATAQQFVDGQWWYARSVASRYIGVWPLTLDKWATDCPWLGGEGIDTRNLPSAYGRILPYFAKNDLDRAKTAKARSPKIPEVPEHVYIEDAAAQLACHVRTLRKRMKAKRVKVKKVNGKIEGGRSLPRAYVPSWFVDQCKAEKAQWRPAGMITVREAADIHGITIGGIHKRIKLGTLKAYPGTILCKDGDLQPGNRLSQAQVKEWKPRLVWRASPDGNRQRFVKAVESLKEILAPGPRFYGEVKAEARRRGVSWLYMYRAKRDLGVKEIRSEHRGPWKWALPDATPAPPTNGQAATTAPNGQAAVREGKTAGRHREKDRHLAWKKLRVERGLSIGQIANNEMVSTSAVKKAFKKLRDEGEVS